MSKRRANAIDREALENLEKKRQKSRETKGRRERLDPEIESMAAFANTSYKLPGKEREDALLERLGEEAKNWRMDEGLSTAETAVWVNHREKQVVTSFRGTQFGKKEETSTFKKVIGFLNPTFGATNALLGGRFDDVRSDIAIATGMTGMDPRFIESQKEFASILDHYSSDEWDHSLASHSLGGSINNHVYGKYSDDIDKVHNFNPGSSPVDVIKPSNFIAPLSEKKDIFNYIIDGDPVSFSAGFRLAHNNLHWEPLRGSTNPHSLEQFMGPSLFKIQ